MTRELLDAEMARLRRSAHRLVWLNPLAAHPEFEPLTRGMRAAVPHTDELLAGNSLASLEKLACNPGGDLTAMKDVLPDITRWLERGDQIALATVVAVKKSAPRPPGAKMAVNSRGEISGGVSGGCVEGAVVEIADGVMTGEPPQLVHFGIADSRRLGRRPSVRRGDRCVDPGLRARPVRRDGPGRRPRGRGHGDRGRFARGRSCWWSRTVCGQDRWVHRSRTTRRFGWAPSCCGPRPPSATARCSSTSMAPAPRLIMFGAVDIAASLCTLARTPGWRPYVVDPRARFATRSGSPMRSR